MEWKEISVLIEPEAVEAAADLFYRLGSGGVVIEDPELLRSMAKSGVWDAYELDDECLTQAHPIVKGYLPVNEQLPAKLEELRTELAEIMARLGKIKCDVSMLTMNEEDWANSWKAYFKPLKSEELVLSSGNL